MSELTLQRGQESSLAGEPVAAARPNGLLVAGVGRSGTSIATNLAMRLGLRGPLPDDVMAPNEANPTGYWESNSLAIFNDELLSRLDATWWTPPDEFSDADLEVLAPLEEPARRAFAAAFGPGDGWVWKDPRLTVLLPFWSRVFGDQPVLLPTRAPQAVARSISARDGIPYEAALTVWERHTRCLLTNLTGRRVLVARYDSLLQQPEVWAKEVYEFVSSSGLPVSPVEGELQLMSPRQQDEGPLPPRIRKLYDVVQDLTGLHESFPALDLPPSGTVEALPFQLSKVIANSAPQSAADQLDNLGALAKELTEERDRIKSDHERLVAERTALMAERALSQQQLRDADVALRALMAERDDACQAAADLGTRVQALTAQLDNQRAVASNAARERDHLGMRLIEAEQRSAVVRPRVAATDLDGLRQRMDQLDNELELIRRTVSWRVTRPLRSVRTAMSRNGGR